MIRVSKILKNAHGFKIYGWIFPDGSYHQVGFGLHAPWTAERLGVEYNGNCNDYSLGYNQGWIRVVGDGASTNNWTDQRLYTLQKFLMTRGLPDSYKYYLDTDLGNDAMSLWGHKNSIATTIGDLLIVDHIRDLGRLAYA